MCSFIMAKQKQKVTVPGMAGWTLLETAKHHGLLSHCTHADGKWDYYDFGAVSYTHLTLPTTPYV